MPSSKPALPSRAWGQPDFLCAALGLPSRRLRGGGSRPTYTSSAGHPFVATAEAKVSLAFGWEGPLVIGNLGGCGAPWRRPLEAGVAFKSRHEPASLRIDRNNRCELDKQLNSDNAKFVGSSPVMHKKQCVNDA